MSPQAIVFLLGLLAIEIGALLVYFGLNRQRANHTYTGSMVDATLGIMWRPAKGDIPSLVRMRMAVEDHILFDFSVNDGAFFEIVRDMNTAADSICKDYTDKGLPCPRAAIS